MCRKQNRLLLALTKLARPPLPSSISGNLVLFFWTTKQWKKKAPMTIMIIIMIIMKVGPRTGFRTVCNISNSGFPCQTVMLCTFFPIFYRQNQAKPRNSNTAIVANRRAYWNQKLELFLSFWTTRTDTDLLFVSLRVGHLWILVSIVLCMRPLSTFPLCQFQHEHLTP